MITQHRLISVCGALAAFAVSLSLPAESGATSLTPLATFADSGDGTGGGWLAPGELGYAYLGTNNLERGLAYGNGHLYLVSRNNPTGTNGNNIRILDALTGVNPSGMDLGGLDVTGISGGTLGVNMVGVGGDGAIYVANLQGDTNAGLYKVYKWGNEAAVPTVAYSGNAGLIGARIGDDLAIIGSGSSTRLAAGFSNSPSVSGNNGYAVIDPTAGTATAVGFAATPPNPGDFRLGITFTDQSHVIGTQGGGTYQYSSYAGPTGTLLGTATLTYAGGATAERSMAYAVVGGKPLLAVQSSGDAHVSVYDITNPLNPLFLASGNATVGALASNANGTGSVAWGPINNTGVGTGTATLYAMRTNSGIQAFTFTLTPPAVAGDYNGNGAVDAADYVLWRDTEGQTVAAGSGADGDGDGTVGPGDYDFWRARFGNTSGSGSAIGAAVVPEPAGFVLVSVGAICAAGRRRRSLSS